MTIAELHKKIIYYFNFKKLFCEFFPSLVIDMKLYSAVTWNTE